jgi:hypothetical protein
MARLAVSIAVLGMFAACTAEVDDPSFNSDDGAMTGSSGSGSSESEGGDSNTQGSNSNTSATTASDEESSGGGGGSTSGAADSSGGVSSATTGAAGCGDGMISPGEQCDGADLQGFDCTSLGLSGGTLSCDPVTCTFDTSMCMSTTGGTSG